VGWISALPWNQAPPGLRERATEELPPCSAEQPGVRAVAEKLLVHGQEYLAVLKYSAPFAARATAQPDHQHEPRAAVPATLLEGIE
jgi:hypothetical protein